MSRSRNRIGKLAAAVLVAGCLSGALGGVAAHAQGAEAAASMQAAAPAAARGVAVAYAIALVVGLACLGAGYAVAKVGAAALGAAVERPELLGRALIFVGLAEGIAIYGLIFGILLLGKL